MRLPRSLSGRRWVVVIIASVTLALVAAGATVWVLGREHFPEGSAEVPASTQTTSEMIVDTATGKKIPVSGNGTGLSLAELPETRLPGNFSRCVECHAILDVRIRNQQAITPNFAHRFHLDEGAECADCHETPTHAASGTRRPPMEKCFESCHAHDKAGAPPGECSACHPKGFPLEPATHSDPEWLPVRERMDEVTGKHTDGRTPDDLGECSLCHSKQFCNDCHKMDMPHPANWTDGHPETAREVGGSACVRCHPDRKSCADCHHKGYEDQGPWVDNHFKAAEEEGVGKCIGCHSTKTCAHCHTTGEYVEYD